MRDAGSGAADAGRVRLSVRAGNHQIARTGQPFRAQLTALVVDGTGSAAAGVRVTFRVTSGSALFGHGARAATSTTGASGVATAQVLSAGPAVGAVQVSASAPSAWRPARYTLRVIAAPAGRGLRR